MYQEKFPFKNFVNPLYFSTKLWVQFGLTSRTARILFFLQTLLELKCGPD